VRFCSDCISFPNHIAPRVTDSVTLFSPPVSPSNALARDDVFLPYRESTAVKPSQSPLRSKSTSQSGWVLARALFVCPCHCSLYTASQRWEEIKAQYVAAGEVALSSTAVIWSSIKLTGPTLGLQA
jgi:hypothetical protein